MRANSKLLNFTLASILLGLILVFLYQGQSLLIPFVIAIAIWYLILLFVNALRAIPYLGRHIPRWISYIIAASVALSILWFIFNLISSNVAELITLIPSYQQRFIEVRDEFFHFIGIHKQPDFSQFFDKYNAVNIMSSIAGIMTDLGRNVGIILIYILFLLLEYHSFNLKLTTLIKDPEKLASIQTMIEKISVQIHSYLKIKTFVGLLTAVCSYLIMLIIGVNFPDFWALLIFLFNFIPNIGSIVATIFPCLLTLVQFHSYYPFFIVLAALSTIQFLFGNVLEPRLLGRSFGLSPLAIIVSLSIWGYLWGIVGMFLCVPIMVIITIIFANFKATLPISILLSEKGEIK